MKRALADLPVPAATTLNHLFNLTPAEARLAQILAHGVSMHEAARRMGVKVTTARKHLAAIFDKTQTNRQPQLVAILSRLAHLQPETARPGALS